MFENLFNTLEKIAGEAAYQADNLVKNGKAKYDEYVKVKGEMAAREAQEEQEKAEALAREAKEKEEEQLRIEKELLDAEKNRLLQLSDKELLVEAVLALKGFNSRISDIQKAQDNLSEAVDAVQTEQNELKEDLEKIEKRLDKDPPFRFSAHPDD